MVVVIKKYCEQMACRKKLPRSHLNKINCQKILEFFFRWRDQLLIEYLMETRNSDVTPEII
jgi:hypothetical protein